MNGPDDLFRKIVDTALEGVWVVDKDNRTTYVNARMGQMLGYGEGEMLGASILGFWKPEDRPASIDSGELRKGGIARMEESRVLCRDGTSLPVLVATHTLTGPDGEYSGAVALVTDISERIKGEEELRKSHAELAGLVKDRSGNLEAVLTVLSRSEQRYRALLESAPAVIALLDQNGSILFINRVTAPDTIEKMIGTSVFERLPPDQHGALRDVLVRIFEKGEPASYHSRVMAADGRARWFENCVSPMVTGGKVKGAIYISIDVSERRSAEEALERRTRAMVAASTFMADLAAIQPGSDIRPSIVRRFREFAGASAAWFCDFDSAAMALAVTNMDIEPRLAAEAEKFLGASVASLRFPVSGQMHEEILRSTVGRRSTLQEVTFGAVPDDAAAAIQTLLGAERFIGVAFVLEGRLFGTLVMALGRGTPEPSEDALVMMSRMAAISLRRRKSEGALLESEERFRTAFEEGPLGMAVTDLEYRFLGSNTMFCRILGYSAEELSMLTFRDFTHPDHLAQDIEGLKRLAAGDLPAYRAEKRYIRKDGSEIWGRLTVSLLHNAEGKAIHHLVMLEDVTAGKRLAAAIRESEQRYRSLVENSSEGILLTAPDGRILSANPAACLMLGRSEEILRRMGRGAVADAADPRLGPALEERGRTGKFKGELRLLRADGTEFPAEVSSNVFDLPGGEKRTVMIIRDLTEGKRAEESIRASEARYRSLFENMQEGYAYCRMRYDAGGRPADWTYLAVNRAFGRLTGLENVVGRNATELMPNVRETDPELFELYGRTARTGRPATREVRVSADGVAAGWLNLSVFSPAEGDFAVVFTDITERKKTELSLRRALMRYELEEGRLYLAMESWPNVALEAFKDLLKAGYEGFALTRPAGAESARRERLGCAVLFLSSRVGPGALPPDADRITRWAEGLPPGRAILVDRLDYLAARAGFAQALHLVHRLAELSRLRNHIILLSVDPATLTPREARLLEKEAQPIEPLIRESVAEDLLEAMRHIYERNISGVRPTLASVGRDLGLSKPTVRKRVRALLCTGYVISHSKGSGKTLEMTEKGRAVLLG